MDDTVVRSLILRNQSGNIELVSRIEELYTKPRYLDKAPERFKLIDIESERLPQYGAYKDYVRNYFSLYRMAEEKPCVLVYNNEEYTCDYDIFIALKALVITGTTKDNERAKACDLLFRSILTACVDGTVDIDRMVDALHIKGGYIKDELTRAIMETMFDGRSVIEFYLYEVYGDNSYKQYYDFYSKFDDYDSFMDEVREVYRKAVADPNFTVVRKDGEIKTALRYIN